MLSTSSFRHRTTIFIWLAVSAFLAIGGAVTGIRTVLPGPSSQAELLANDGEHRAIDRGMILRDTLLLIVEHATIDIDAEHFVAAREDLFSLLRSTSAYGSGESLFKSIQTPGHTWLPTDRLISPDRRSVLFLAETATSRARASEAMKLLPRSLSEWQVRHPSFRVHYLSHGTTDNEIFQLINEDLDSSLVLTLPLTLLVLIWSFGSITAAMIPLVVALVSLAASLGFTAIISAVWAPVSATAAQLVVLLVLAIGVDYSLFFVSRMREEISNGVEPNRAARNARTAISPAVAWSGVTVALSLVGLILMRDAVLTSMAFVSLVSVGITVAGTLAAVPAILALVAARFGVDSRKSAIAGWLPRVLLELSLRRPWIVLAGIVLVLASVSSLCFRMHLGSTVQPETLPKSMQSAQAYDALARSFPSLAGPEFTLVLESQGLRELEDEGRLQPFLEAITSSASVTGPLAIDSSSDGSMMRYHFRAVGSSNDPENIALIHRMENELIPELLSPLKVSAWLSGTLPFSVKEVLRYKENFPQVLGGVLILSFCFLLLAFRSIVIPCKAVLLNVLSTTTSFGMLVLIFQYLPTPWWYGQIESFVPALLFSILFGLSMDYHVFLVARMTEERSSGLEPEEAIRRGIMATARTVTSAALIMISVFCIIASLRLPMMKQLGAGLAIAVMIDATVVRTMLLPASMLLLGKWNWHLPNCLRWLPSLRIH